MFAFLLSTMGFSVTTHHCKSKKKTTVSIQTTDKKSCCGKKKMSKDCCKDETKVLKVTNNFTSPQTTKLALSSPHFLALIFVQNTVFSLTTEPQKQFEYYHASPDRAISRSILFHSFLI